MLSTPLVSLVFFTSVFVSLIYTSSYSRILKNITLDTYVYPSKLHPDIVQPVLSQINAQDVENEMKGFIHDLPGDRYYKSDNGRKAAMYVKDYLYDLIGDSSQPDRFEVALFDHEWKQPSIIFKVKRDAIHSKKNEKKVIIGCHIDSINFKFYEDAPGVDDNLSGIVTIMQCIKHLIKLVQKGQISVKNTVEFHFYSAEEIGSLGSIQVFEAYKRENSEVVALLQQDMTGYIEKSTDSGYQEHFGIITDYVSTSLMQFTKGIIEAYCDIPYLETQCGRICSDHISALMYGYPGVYVLESMVDLSNPFIHSAQDTIEKINFTHMVQHAKLTTSFALELAISDEIVRRGSVPSDTVSFRFVDFMILLMMHHTKRFIYSVLAFGCAIASFYVLVTDGTSSDANVADETEADTVGGEEDDNRGHRHSPRRPRNGRKHH